MGSFSFLSFLISVARLSMVCSAVVPPIDGLGPGKNEWVVADPAKYGLDQEELNAAAKLVGKLVPERGCLLITKNGEIVAEDYYGFSADTRWETDSMAKTFAAALFGVVVEMGILDLDTPLAHYGMKPFASWNRSGIDFWPNVTARHLLTQTSGYGVVPPGTKMTYDSNLYIQHLSHFLTHVRYSAQHFATHYFAKPLGTPNLYVYDSQRWFPEMADEISVGGGQMVTCREAARIGQFILNRGLWRGQDGLPVRLGNEDYFRQMLSPAYPGVVDGYGFLTWLNTDHSKKDSDGKSRSHCCGPRFGGNKKMCSKDGKQCGFCCEAQPGYKNSSVPCDVSINAIDPTYKQANLSGASMYVAKQLVGDDLSWAPSSPESIGIGFGQYAKYMLLLPESNMQIISMGMSYGKSLNCPDAYNDMTSLAFLWSALANSLRLGNKTDVCNQGSACGHEAPTSSAVLNDAEVANDKTAPTPRQRRTRRRGGQEVPQATEWISLADAAVKAADENDVSSTIGVMGQIWGGLTHAWSTIPVSAGFLSSLMPVATTLAPADIEAPGENSENPVVGSCYCGCPPDLLVGMCFNVKKDKAPLNKDCSRVPAPDVDGLNDVCPTIGLVLQCDPAAYKPEELCSNETLQGGGMKCHSKTPCQPVATLPNTWQATCQCVPTHWIDDAGDAKCSWSDDPCVFSSYYTP